MNDVIRTHLIELDEMSLTILKHLREHQAEEPRQPTEENSRYQHEEMTALHYEWARTHQAIRLLLGVQLVNLAVDQLDQRGDVPG
jgi:hypothetical protein